MAKNPVAEIEEWRSIPGCHGYEASSLGRIRSLDRWVTYKNGIRHFYKGATLQPVPCRSYLVVNLGRARCKRWHVIICTAFHGPKPTPLHQCAHWNGDPHDNRPGNLRWATPKENKADQARHGTHPIGAQHYKARLSEGDVRAIRAMRSSGMILKDIALHFGVSLNHIHRIANNQSWKHLA